MIIHQLEANTHLPTGPRLLSLLSAIFFPKLGTTQAEPCAFWECPIPLTGPHSCHFFFP